MWYRYTSAFKQTFILLFILNNILCTISDDRIQFNWKSCRDKLLSSINDTPGLWLMVQVRYGVGDKAILFSVLNAVAIK